MCSLKKILKSRHKRKYLLQFQAFISIPLYSCALLHTCQWFAMLSGDGNILTCWGKICHECWNLVVWKVFLLFTGSIKSFKQSSIVNLLLHVPCFQIDQITVYIKLYISLHFIKRLLIIFHNITRFLSYVPKVSQKNSFQFGINTFNSN